MTRGTCADIVALPAHLTGELIDGELVITQRGTPHRSCVRGHEPGGWWILFMPELHLGGDVLVPEVAGWHRARLPKLPHTVRIETAPDWVCEIAQTWTPAKAAAWSRAAVPSLRIVDVEARTLTVGDRLFAGTSESVRIPPFDAVTFDLRWWWWD